MSDELRNARRARLSGVRVTIEGATGRRHQAEVADLSRDGLFIISKTPLAIGKRLSLEIYVVGEAAVWSALGRVIWTRETGGRNGEPPGMGVKIIDIDDVAAAAVDRLVETREQTEPGLGVAEKVLPERERTMLGVGSPSEPPVPASPVIVPSPVREATLVGVGATGAGTKEPSLPIDLVAKKPSTVPPASTAVPSETGRAEPSKADRRSGGRGFLLLAFIAGCVVSGYAARDRLMTLFQPTAPTELSNAAPAPPPPPSEASPANASVPAATMGASPTLDAKAPLDSGRSALDATAAFSGAPAAASAPSTGASTKRAPAALSSTPAPHKPKSAEDANPY